MKIKTQHVPPECGYLTNGKEYEVFGNQFFRACPIIIDDLGEARAANIKASAHLNGKAWEVIEDD
ncbi:MAG: hypothetical protein ABUJ92_00200 [Desulfobacterales bacterium]